MTFVWTVLVLGCLTAVTTGLVAQSSAISTTESLFTVGYVTTVFLAGGAFAVVKREARHAHERLDAHIREQAVTNAELTRKIERMSQRAAEQHVAILTAIAETRLELVDRINAAPQFDRREHG